MILTPSQHDLLQSQAGFFRPPKLSSLYKERTKTIVLTHFDQLQTSKYKRPWLFSFLGGSLVVAAFALVFSYTLLRPQFLIRQDPELSTLEDDLQSFSIPTESFE